MSFKEIINNEHLNHYLDVQSMVLPKYMNEIVNYIHENDLPLMQISSLQARFFIVLTRLIQARHILELGTYLGYSTLAFAEGIIDGGKIMSCDISDQYISIAKKYWKMAGHDNKISFYHGNALNCIQELKRKNEIFDLIFIDANKSNYREYYEGSLSLLRTGGVLLIDNTLWGGDVWDEDKNDASTQAIRNLNDMIKNDHRVFFTLLPIGDGTTIVVKK